MNTPAFASRFHAIITAKSIDGAGPPVIAAVPTPVPHPHNQWGVRSHYNYKKRRRDSNSEAGPSTPTKAVRRASDDEGTSAKEPTKSYRDRDDLMKAMREHFRQGPDVSFHGVYETQETGMTHKQAIQTVAHEIWKTTGYRFTVKDHPQFTNGHKTRFWCSQDDAHRSKSSRTARKAQGDCYKPRVTSAGEVMAKARYPCRSRLLISSRDSASRGTRSITVRMHHHVSHEPYVDANLPPEVVQRLWETFGWLTGDASMMQAPETSGGAGQKQPSMPDITMEDEVSSDVDAEAASMDNGYGLMDNDVPHQHPEHPQPFVIANHNVMPQLPAVSLDYRARMQAHIKNLREFADGLEYQLQFGDYRMLEMLEREGGSFLELVRDCLQKEGRLVPIEPLPMPGPSHSHCEIPAIGSMSTNRSYEGNPGINPRALDC